MSNVCPACDANNLLEVNRCWLCGGDLEPKSKPAETITHVDVLGKAIRPKPVRPSKSREEIIDLYYVVAAILIAITIYAIGTGLQKEARGIAAILRFVAAPAVFGTLGLGLQRRRRGEKFSARKTILDFTVSATVIGTSVAVTMGMMVFCLYLLLWLICTGMKNVDTDFWK